MEKKRGFIGTFFFIMGIVIASLLSLFMIVSILAEIISGATAAVVYSIVAFLIVCPGFDPLLQKIPGKAGKILTNRALRIVVALILYIIGSFVLADSMAV